MRNESNAPVTEKPHGLLQDTNYTNPENIITIKRVTDLSTEDLISFTNVPTVEAFYKQRGLTPGDTQPTNAISIRILALELLKIAEIQEDVGDPNAEKTAEYVSKLHAAIGSLNKSDTLLCSFTVPSPITL